MGRCLAAGKGRPLSAPVRVVRFDHWIDGSFDRIVSGAPGFALEVLQREGDDGRAWRELERAQVYAITAAKDEIPRRFFAEPALIERCPGLLVVSSNGSGCDTIDIDACTRAGIAVVNQAGGNADSVAELAVGLMLAVSRRVVESDRLLKSRRGFSREDLMGHELRGRTLGVVGVGHAGRRVATLGAAFGMTVLGVDPAYDAAQLAARGVQSVPFDELLARADIVTLHCPRDATTLGLMGAAQFAAMKSGAIFVSTARGGIHDEAALHAALVSGHLAGAGLDVWDREPPPLDHPLLTLTSVVATFHTAGVTHEARRNNATLNANQIVALMTTGALPARLVNPGVWTRAEQRIRAAASVTTTTTTIATTTTTGDDA